MQLRRIMGPIAAAGTLIAMSATTLSAAPLTPASPATNVMPAANALISQADASAKPAKSYLHLVDRRSRKGWRRGKARRHLRHRRFRNRNRALRRHYYGGRRYYGHRRHRGGAIAAGVAGLIIGGAIAASRRDYRSRWEQCDDRYRTFRWSDGTYIPYAGSPRVLCPYLRG